MRVNLDLCPTFGNQDYLTRYYAEMQAGGRGHDIITDTVQHVRNYYELVSLNSNTRILSATFYPTYSASSYTLSATTIPAGVSIKGDFSSVTLSGGAVVGYFMSLV